MTCPGSTGQASSRILPDCQCPVSGYYNDPAQNECQPCVNTRCNTCVNGTACDTCVGVQNAAATREFPTCACPQGWYDFASSLDCQKCNNECLSCVSLPSQCTARNYNIYLQSHSIIPPQPIILSLKFFTTYFLTKQTDCAWECGSCQFNATFCLTCKGNRLPTPSCPCPDG